MGSGLSKKKKGFFKPMLPYNRSDLENNAYLWCVRNRGVAGLPKRPELPGKEKGGIAVKAGHHKTGNGHRDHHGVQRKVSHLGEFTLASRERLIQLWPWGDPIPYEADADQCDDDDANGLVHYVVSVPKRRALGNDGSEDPHRYQRQKQYVDAPV